MWRSKDMTRDEIAVFTRTFRGVYELSVLNEDMALFLHREEDEPGGTVAITGNQSMFLEITSPGGWRNCEPPVERGWKVLAGNPRTVTAAPKYHFMMA